MDNTKLQEMLFHLWSLAEGRQHPLPNECELCGEIRRFYLTEQAKEDAPLHDEGYAQGGGNET